MGFFGYFLRRLSLVIPTLLGVTIITFTLTYVLPGNPAVVKAGPLGVSPEVVKELEKAMGLDQPAWVQYGRVHLGRPARRSRTERVDRPSRAGGFQATPTGDLRADARRAC